MALVWITGNSGTGKSTVCQALRSRGHTALDADNEALAVPRRGEDLLVFEYHDSTKDATCYRPLGGGINFGETAEAAVRRQLREELDVDLLDVRLLGVLENLFHAFGRAGHEIVFVFDCRLADQSRYERDTVGEILDDAGTKVMWRPLSSFNADSPLYPAGLTDLLRGRQAGSR